jgi:hypothetical protein
MKSKFISVLLLASGSMALFSGCCTAGRTTAWEYKVAYPSGRASDANSPDPNRDPELQQAFLNKLASDGWVFVGRDPSSGLFYFKRAKQ